MQRVQLYTSLKHYRTKKCNTGGIKDRAINQRAAEEYQV